LLGFVNQWQQRSRDEYLGKEKLYRDLLEALQSFYESPARILSIPSTALLSIDQQKTKRQEFFNQLSLAWLYAPDAVMNGRTLSPILYTLPESHSRRIKRRRSRLEM
jgi:hypothetical protein